MKGPSPERNNISTDINKKHTFHRRSLTWIVILVIVFLLSWLLPVTFFDNWYYRGIFQWIRVTYDYVLGWLPLPMIYVVVLIVLVRTIRWSFDWKRGVMFQLSRALGGIAFIISVFYIFWGFNYHQVTLQDRLGFNLNAVSPEDMEAEFRRATEVLKKEAEELPDHYTSDEAIASLRINDNDLRPDVEKALADLDIPNSGRVRVRQLWPNGFLLRWSTAGIYIPHAGEGHIDKGLLSVQKPFTIAHEMAHGYGITDEGACNFIAWLACSQSRDKWIRFGGALTYWRYTAAEMTDDKVTEVINTFDPVVARSMLLIRENDRKYPDILPQIRDAIYSSYLKRHGVEGGLRSYNYVVMMVSEYLKRESEENGMY